MNFINGKIRDWKTFHTKEVSNGIDGTCGYHATNTKLCRSLIDVEGPTAIDPVNLMRGTLARGTHGCQMNHSIGTPHHFHNPLEIANIAAYVFCVRNLDTLGSTYNSNPMAGCKQSLDEDVSDTTGTSGH